MQAEQLRAARALLDWSQAELARVSGVSLSTIKRMEKGTGPIQANHANVEAVRIVLEQNGVEFLYGDKFGVQVRP